MTTQTKPKLYIREWRTHRGLTQTELSRRSGVAPETLNTYENGNRKNRQPYPVTLNALAMVLDVAPYQLWGPPPADVAESTEAMAVTDGWRRLAPAR